MWCANCKADVAAEYSAEAQSVHCANCGYDLEINLTGQNSSSQSQRAEDSTHARELLARWSNEELFDSLSSIDVGPLEDLMPPKTPELNEPEQEEETKEQPELDPKNPSTAPTPASSLFTAKDSRQTAEDRAENELGEQPDPPAIPPRTVRRRRPGKLRADAPATTPPAAKVHTDVTQSKPARREPVDIQAAINKHRIRNTNWTTLAGQLLAYIGVLMLTGGASLVIYSYFGSKPEFAPTGWLVATAGQMMLFLGVITLVSGGLEQTTNEVSDRIDSLGKRLIRIEQATVPRPNSSRQAIGSARRSDNDDHPQRISA